MNTGRIVGGGLVCGVVMNLIDWLGNGVLLVKQWDAETAALNPGLMAKAGANSALGWIIVDFLTGILTIWLYAAIRPRFGPGPKTALIAGLVAWLFTHVFFSSYVFMGLYSFGLIACCSLAGLIGGLLGAVAGGAVYKEA